MTAHRRPYRLLPFLGIALLTLGACQEDLSGGAACPTLCPGQQLEVHDTVLVGTELLDTTVIVNGMPPLGTETQLLVARRGDAAGDSVVSGAVLRFDTLIRNFTRTDTTKPVVPIARVSAASLQFTTTPDTTLIKDSVRFEVIDVDAPVADLDTATIHQLFVTRAPIGAITVSKDSLLKLQTVPLDTAFITHKIVTGGRVRLGVRLVGVHNTSAQVGIVPITTPSTGPALRYVGYAAAPDTTDSTGTVVNYSVSVSSGGPEFKYLANYQLVLKGSPPAPPGLLPVGGLPASRLYMRFNIPAALIDSSTTIVRATLILHQRGDSTFPGVDSVSLTPRVVIASPLVTDISKAALLIADPTLVALQSVKVNPLETRADTIPLVSRTASLVALWRTERAVNMQRALVLQSSLEGREPRRFLIYSNAALPDSLRPRLLLTYIPRSGFGLP